MTNVDMIQYLKNKYNDVDMAITIAVSNKEDINRVKRLLYKRDILIEILKDLNINPNE